MNIASIDIGTNTVLLLIADINLYNSTIKPLVNEYRMPRIGKGLSRGSTIGNNKIEALYKVLSEYFEIIKRHKCETVLSVGTNALRFATNSMEIISEIKIRWSIDVKIIPGIEEARLSYLGATYQSIENENVVIDIGGGSTEIIYGSSNKILFSHSFQIGSVSLTEQFVENDPAQPHEIVKIKNEIRNIFYKTIENIPTGIDTIAVAGTPTSLAGIKLGLLIYDETKVDNSNLTNNDLDKFIKHFMSMHNKELLKENPVFLAGREDVILAGTIILSELMKSLKIKSLTVSTKGIRYGLVIDYLQKYSE